MNLPNLTRIVDTYIPITSTNHQDYYNQLRSELLPPIRKLQNDDLLEWFCFFIHPSKMLKDGPTKNRELTNNRLFIHIHLEPNRNININKFIKTLPEHFFEPIQKPLSNIGGLESSLLLDENWAYAWKIIGESSEWILSLIEKHKDKNTFDQVKQFLHLIENPLGLLDMNQ